ncbi:MAG TPA: SRPBCC family protein [Planktothrix sp.]|jgi:hypothetical protein
MMRRVIAQESKLVGAPPEKVYRIFADPRHHAHILAQCISDYSSCPDGTVRCRIEFGGVKRDYHFSRQEVEPNRLFCETDLKTKIVTEFICEPHAEGTLATIRVDYQAASSLLGLIESMVAPSFLRKMYDEELTKLARYALVATV